MHRKVMWTVLLLVLGLVLAACGGGGGGGSKGPATYSVSGTIADGDGQTVADVLVHLAGSDIQPTTVTTDKKGSWEAAGLKGEVTVTLVHDDYKFDPVSRTVTKPADDVNFIAMLSGAPDPDPDPEPTDGCAVNGPGLGTEESPYTIYDVYDLQNIAENLSAHYILCNNIDASETTSWDDNAGFEPIAGGFEGILDGDGFKIIGLHINRPNMEVVGMFVSIMRQGEVRNLGLVDGYVRGGHGVYGAVGAIAGRNAGTIRNSYNAGEVQGTEGGRTVGGIVGVNNGGSWARPGPGLIIDSYNAGPVGTADKVSSVGGIAGQNGSGGKIKNSYNKGQVGAEGNHGNVGGIVGLMRRTIPPMHQTDSLSGTEVVDSYNVGPVFGGVEHVGGIVGSALDGVAVRNSYNTGPVKGKQYVGGVVGNNVFGSVIENSHNTGSVEGTNYVGGVAGINSHNFNREMAKVEHSWNEGPVKGREYVGGVVGLNTNGGEVKNSHNIANVTGTDWVGGVVGTNNVLVEAAYNTGRVSGVSYVGGVVGDNSGGIVLSFNTGSVAGDWRIIGGVAGNHYRTSGALAYIENSYNHGSVTGTGEHENGRAFWVGGVVGYHRGSITNTYNTGPVAAETGDDTDVEDVGALVGEAEEIYERGVIKSSYYLTGSGPHNGYGASKTAGQLQQEDTFAGWDFDFIWTTHGDTDYPDLNDNPRLW